LADLGTINFNIFSNRSSSSRPSKQTETSE